MQFNFFFTPRPEVRKTMDFSGNPLPAPVSRTCGPLTRDPTVTYITVSKCTQPFERAAVGDTVYIKFAFAKPNVKEFEIVGIPYEGE